uniref:Si:ch73-359m17.2 n=1 Tax=Neolamprologus brichardi TaxID=32507 RepID=A0A3Q4MKN9_NEOBR
SKKLSVLAVHLMLQLHTCGCSSQLLYNLALKRPAVQSSTSGPWGTAGRAVDGNRDASYQRGSCTLTSGQSNPWWRVDLVNVYTIGAVMIINRDEMENRLDGAEIWIGNSTSISNSKSIRCAVISHIPKGQAFYFPCNSVKGRYVTVRLPFTDSCPFFPFNNLVEPLQNVALNRETVQSSVFEAYGPSKGVDGCRNGNLDSGCCTHTLEDLDPWWRVDLLAVYKVSAVTIINRQDAVIERILGAQILIGNSLEQNSTQNPSCGMIKSLAGTPTYTFQCNEMEGRYVIVIIPGIKRYMTLCEVEVEILLILFFFLLRLD